MLDERSAEENICRLATPSGVIVDGMTLSAIAERERKDWADAVIDLVLEQRHALRGILSLASDEALALEIRQPWIKFGTDAAALDPDSAPTAVHPRAYGTYPHILSRFVRQDRALSLEEAVRKMTSAVASRLSIPDRGLLREGMYADIVVFDPVMVADHATYADPQRLSTGVQYVFVNGVEVVHSGAHTGAKPGRVVRGPGWSR